MDLTMEKKCIAVFPAPGTDSRNNLFISNMFDLLSEQYDLVGIEQISNDINEIKKVKAVILNWMESSLNDSIKRNLILYKMMGVKICWVFHNRIPHDCNQSSEIRNMKWLADFCNYIIVLSKVSKEYLPHARRNIKKCVYIPHIHYIDQYPVCKRDVRKEHEIAEDEFVFSFIGALRPYKNIEVVIQAFKELSLKNARLLIAGSEGKKNYVSKLRMLCGEEKNIILDAGIISNGEMESYLRASNVLTLPYNKVSSMNSGAMIMAFSYGRTVIIPEIAMAKDMKENAFFFVYDYVDETENIRQMKEKMLEAYQMGQEGVRTMGEKARSYVRENNSKEKVWEGLRKLGL